MHTYTNSHTKTHIHIHKFINTRAHRKYSYKHIHTQKQKNPQKNIQMYTKEALTKPRIANTQSHRNKHVHKDNTSTHKHTKMHT